MRFEVNPNYWTTGGPNLDRRISRCFVILALLVPVSAGASEETIGPIGINSAGLTLPNGTPLTGADIGIGQVELSRPGDPLNPNGTPFDTDSDNINSSVNPEGVFFTRYDNPDIPGISNRVPNSDWVTFNALVNGPTETTDARRTHAVEVAGVMVSTDTQPVGTPRATGVSTGAKLYSIGHDVIAGRELSASLMSQFIAEQNGGDVRAINMSFAIARKPANILDGNAPFTQFVDWSAAKHDTLYVSAGNQLLANGTPDSLSLPTDNFNGITVARSVKEGGVYRKVSSRNYYGNDAAGTRTSIDILAPGDDILVASTLTNNPTVSGTSFAAPHVTGTVALLQEYGDERILNAGNPAQWNPNARQHEVMKAVLMNSADKLKDNGDGNLLGMTRTVLDSSGNDWLASEAANNALIPVDDEFGTGHLNADRAFTQFQSGEQDADGANVSVIGWDYGTPTTIFDDYRYVIGEPLRQGSRLAVTLTWDRIVEFDINNGDMNDNGRYDVGDTFETYNNLDEVVNDLDLLIVPRGDVGTNSVAVSVGDVQDGGYNLEHLFAEIPTTGLYDIIVRHFANSVGIPLGIQNYGIAWWGVSDAPLSGDFDADGDVDGADFLVWQRNTSIGNLTDWQNNYGSTGTLTASTAVPEPSCLMLLALGLPLLVGRPRN